MEPKKVKRAITITVIVALILILFCLCLLFDWIRFPSKTAERPAETEEVTEVLEPSSEPQPEPEQAPPPEAEEGPSVEDLNGCSDKLYYPKQESYLPAYETMTVRPASGDSVYLQYRPEKVEYTTDVITKLKQDTVVTALAKENGYTLVLVQEGVAGWIRTHELAAH